MRRGITARAIRCEEAEGELTDGTARRQRPETACLGADVTSNFDSHGVDLGLSLVARHSNTFYTAHQDDDVLFARHTPHALHITLQSSSQSRIVELAKMDTGRLIQNNPKQFPETKGLS